ncbi:unnamed protein product [Peniophora sp. CBMAI 1063]|nr:unnamed protein product [Peniophora sp. CBMAI 1063]
MSATPMPPQLKAWVERCFSQMQSLPESNRADATNEMKKVISEAQMTGTMWTTDWAAVQLQSLLPKPMPTGNKRKFNDYDGVQHTQPTGKKAKKKQSQITKSVSSNALDPNDKAALERRAQRFQREHAIEQQKAKGVSFSGYGKKSGSHHNNKHGGYARARATFGDDDEEALMDPNVPNWDHHTLVGTSQEVLRPYFRLTSAPQPENVRPLPVLHKTFAELKRKWREPRDVVPYNHITSWFKSLRQDLVVQRIKNEFTVQVYEAHARMALEMEDLPEFNSCLNMLSGLYDMGIAGRRDEFTAYTILMLCYGRNFSALNLHLGRLTQEQKQDPAISQALAIHRAMTLGNYHALFKLYAEVENMGGYIMDHLVDRERLRALLVICKAYKQISVAALHLELGFDSLAEVYAFLVAHGIAFFTNPNDVDENKQFACPTAAAAVARVVDEKFSKKVQMKGRV